MKVHLAAIAELKKEFESGKVDVQKMFALESFYGIPSWIRPFIPKFASFLLDSGAFTFISSKKKGDNIDWNSYADSYADFIVENKVKQYFELDIDALVGLKTVERLRNRIEKRTGIASIPVWHFNRGKQYFIDMAKDYSYVAIGGYVSRDIPRSLYEKMFPWFINTAHQNNTKIHALGYTDTIGLHKYHFDTVDSSCWVVARRFGEVSKFERGYIKRVTKPRKDMKIKDTTSINWFSFNEWLKFQRYAENNL